MIALGAETFSTFLTIMSEQFLSKLQSLSAFFLLVHLNKLFCCGPVGC